MLSLAFPDALGDWPVPTAKALASEIVSATPNAEGELDPPPVAFALVWLLRPADSLPPSVLRTICPIR